MVIKRGRGQPRKYPGSAYERKLAAQAVYREVNRERIRKANRRYSKTYRLKPEKRAICNAYAKWYRLNKKQGYMRLRLTLTDILRNIETYSSREVVPWGI